MTKSTEQRLSKAGEALQTLKAKGDEATAVDIRKARKNVKRAGRRFASEKVANAKKEANKAGYEKNLTKAKEKETKRKEAQESALTKAAEKQAESDAKAKAEQEAAQAKDNEKKEGEAQPAKETAEKKPMADQ